MEYVKSNHFAALVKTKGGTHKIGEREFCKHVAHLFGMGTGSTGPTGSTGSTGSTLL